MAELDIAQEEEFGIKKEIDEGALDLVFQNIQGDMYAFPVKSFVRETISNALDAVVEKTQALDILRGAQTDKYYRQKNDGKLLKDSNFDPSYYNPKFLSEDDLVYVDYKEQIGRDTISIKDKCIGLGGSRLRGFFKIGYSSKRNMKHVMGKFGSGSKSGLATGVPYFVLTSIYNGYKTTFMIYQSKYEPITPKTDVSKEEIWEVTMANDSKNNLSIFWEPTNEKNSVEIILEVKKHNKDLFINSVTEQFQYFKNAVHLKVTDMDNYPTINKVLDITPHYESENLIIPKTSTYTSPHIIVDGISYGLISWDELELQKRQGRIAIKVSASEVDITQSRESLKWTEKTKDTIKNAIKAAEKESSDYISQSLHVTESDNIFDFNNKYSVMKKDSSDQTSHVFSKFLDINSIVPKYKFTINVKGFDNAIVPIKLSEYLGTNLFTELFYKFTVRLVSVTHSGGMLSIKSSYPTTFHEIANLPIVYSSETSLGPKRAQHLLNTRFPDNDSFLYIRTSEHNKPRDSAAFLTPISTGAVFGYMLGVVMKYSTVKLDYEDWTEVEEEVSEEVQVIEADVVSRAKYRRLNKLVIFREYEIRYLAHRDSDAVYKRVTTELSIAEIKEELRSQDVIVCTNEYKDLGRLLDAVKALSKNDNTRIIYVAKDVLKHFLPYSTFITEYFRKFNPKTNELMIGQMLHDMATLKKFSELTVQHNVMTKPELASKLLSIDLDKFNYLRKCAARGSQPTLAEMLIQSYTVTNEAVSMVMTFMERMAEFQKILNTGDQDAILAKSTEFFGAENVYTLDSYDTEFIGNVKSELDRVSVCSPIIRSMIAAPKDDAIKQLNELINYKNSIDVSI